MKCPKCQFENREMVKYCEECGAKLELTCPCCGTQSALEKYRGEQILDIVSGKCYKLAY